jgi:hypothetical protein
MHSGECERTDKNEKTEERPVKAMENAEVKQVENLPTFDYQKMGTVELRTLVRERGLAKGSAVASANKADLIALLNGTGTLEAPTLPASDELADVLKGKVDHHAVS